MSFEDKEAIQKFVQVVFQGQETGENIAKLGRVIRRQGR